MTTNQTAQAEFTAAAAQLKVLNATVASATAAHAVAVETANTILPEAAKAGSTLTSSDVRAARNAAIDAANELEFATALRAEYLARRQATADAAKRFDEAVEMANAALERVRDADRHVGALLDADGQTLNARIKAAEKSNSAWPSFRALGTFPQMPANMHRQGSFLNTIQLFPTVPAHDGNGIAIIKRTHAAGLAQTLGLSK